MKWGQLRRALNRKTDSKDEKKSKRHDRIWVVVGEMTVGPVLVSRSSSEMNNREIGNCARSLGLQEGEFKEFVACPMDRDAFVEAIR